MHPKVSYLACHCAPGSPRSCWGVRGQETFLALPELQIFAVLNEATPRGLPLMTTLLKSRKDIGTENMSPRANGCPWIYHGARLSNFDFDWPNDVPFAVRQFLE